jgi:flagellar basal body-associated protein FliL
MNPEQPAVQNIQTSQAPTSHRKYKLLAGIILVVIICGIGAVYALGSSRNQEDKSTNGTVTPEMIRVQECLKNKNVDSEDWSAYQKAAIDCQSK